jgi:hypothetical protein
MDIVRVELWGESEARRDEGTYTYFYALRVDAIRKEWKINSRSWMTWTLSFPFIPTLFDSCGTTHAKRQGLTFSYSQIEERN